MGLQSKSSTFEEVSRRKRNSYLWLRSRRLATIRPMMMLTTLMVLMGSPALGSILPPPQDYLYLSSSPRPPPVDSEPSPTSRLLMGSLGDEMDEGDYYPSGPSGFEGGNQTLYQESSITSVEGIEPILIGNGSGYLLPSTIAAATTVGTTGSFSNMDNNSTEFLEKIEKELSEYPLRDPLSIAIPMTMIYMLILLSGLVGNISTCVVIAKNNYMHTATNYYLFSLAMSDLLLLISGLPQEIYHIWIKYPYIFGEAFCVIRGLAAETSANATVLTITAFTVERFVAIVYPLKSHKLSQLSRVVRMIGIIWIVAFCLALPQAAQFGVMDHASRYDPNFVLIKGAWCTLVREIFPYAFQISICVFFAIPMTIITVLYVLIGLKLRRSRKGPMAHGSQELSVEPRTQNRHSQSHVVRMLDDMESISKTHQVAVVVAFFICWAPFHLQRLMALYGKSQTETPSDLFMKIYQGVIHVSGILYYISTCINPILYHIMSNKFRQAFKDTMGSLCGRPSSRLHNRTYSAISHRSSRMGVIHHYTSNSQRNNHNRPRDLLATVAESTACVTCCNGTTSTSCSACRAGNTKVTTTAAPSVNNKSKYLRGGSYNNGLDQHNNHHHHHHPCPLSETSLGATTMTLGTPTNSTSATLLNSSPSEKDGMIAMETLDKSQGPPNRQAEKPQQTSGLRAFLCRNKKDSKGKSNKDFKNKRSKGLIMKCPYRPPSDPAIPSTYAVAILDSKGNSKTVQGGIIRRPRTGSSGNAVSIVGIHKNTCRATSYTSVDSGKSNNTISNSSLQDMDETEYTGEELAGYMAELNHNLESPKK